MFKLMDKTTITILRKHVGLSAPMYKPAPRLQEEGLRTYSKDVVKVESDPL